MMAKYKVGWVEVATTRSGKEKKNCVLNDAAGLAIPDVGIWADFPGYAGIMAGSEVEGEIVVKGKYKSLYPPRSAGAPSAPKPASSAAIGVMVEQKNINIEKSQDRKEVGVKVAGAMRDATLILTSLYKEEFEKMPAVVRGDKLREAHKQWVEFFVKSYDDTKKMIEDLPF